jgi:hypothetical protein
MNSTASPFPPAERETVSCRRPPPAFRSRIQQLIREGHARRSPARASARLGTRCELVLPPLDLVPVTDRPDPVPTSTRWRRDGGAPLRARRRYAVNAFVPRRPPSSTAAGARWIVHRLARNLRTLVVAKTGRPREPLLPVLLRVDRRYRHRSGKHGVTQVGRHPCGKDGGGRRRACAVTYRDVLRPSPRNAGNG